MNNFTCPKCHHHLMIKKGQYGEFYGCSNFPNCNFSVSKDNKTFNPNYFLQDVYKLDIPKKLFKLLFKNYHIGVVYFVKIKEKGLIKIGKSSNYISRLSQLNSELNGITPILLLRTRFYSVLEVFFHELFGDFLKSGNEYFDIPPEYLIEVPKLKIFLKEKVEILSKEKVELIKLLEEKICQKIE